MTQEVVEFITSVGSPCNSYSV